MIMQPRNPYLENMRIQRQKGCLYVCGVKFETPIDKMRTSVNAGNNILCPNEPEAPKELDGGNFLVKVGGHSCKIKKCDNETIGRKGNYKRSFVTYVI